MNSSQKSNKDRKYKKFPEFMRRKLAIAFLLIMVMFVSLIGVVIYRSAYKFGDYSRQVLAHQGYDDETIPYKRGDIVDRNGTVLATNEKIYNLILDPYIILSDENITEPTINALISSFGYDRDDLYNVINENSDSNYYRYSLGISDEQKERFEKIEESVNNDKTIRDVIKGVWFEDDYKRVYPYDTLACDLIGFTSSDAKEGYYGLEKYYNDTLTGNDGRVYGIINSDTDYDVKVKNADDGHTIVTTIDTTLQDIVEKRIAEFNNNIGSLNTAVLIMDPNNAEVLAMASYPVFNLNSPYDLTGFFTDTEIDLMSSDTKTEYLSNLWSNFIVSYAYEPGSTAKPLTVSAGLEEGKISMDDRYYCQGYQIIGGWKIRCHVREGHGELSLTDAIVNSCNDSLMQVGKKIGKEIFSDYQNRFGLGQPTGIDLPSEAGGLLYDVNDMKDVELATNSFGQNYTATVLQMTSAYCSIINGGNYYEPHVVKQILDSDGNLLEEIEPKIVRHTVSKTTSDFLIDAMVKTIDNGSAAIPGYSIGGKTGTAQKLPREDNTYIVSLATFFPAYNPQYMMFVVIDEPNVENQSTGGYASALSKSIMQDIIDYYNISPDRVDQAYSTQFSSDVEYDENGVIIED